RGGRVRRRRAEASVASGWRLLRHQVDGGGAEEEGADMGEEGDAAARSRVGDGKAALPELEDEPTAEEEERRQRDDEEADEGEDAGRRQEEEVGAEDARDRAARTEIGDTRRRHTRVVEGDPGLCGRGGEARGEVPEEIAHPPERILDVVAEDPEEEHVPEDVEPARMHEHRAEGALPGREVVGSGGPDARALDGAGVV